MPKRKQPAIIETLEALKSKYDRPTLIRSLSFLKTDVSWQLFRAALMQEYLDKVSQSLENASKTGKQIEAAYDAGAAQTMYDTANNLIDKYIQILENQSPVVEDPRPE